MFKWWNAVKSTVGKIDKLTRKHHGFRRKTFRVFDFKASREYYKKMRKLFRAGPWVITDKIIEYIYYENYTKQRPRWRRHAVASNASVKIVLPITRRGRVRNVECAHGKLRVHNSNIVIWTFIELFNFNESRTQRVCSWCCANQIHCVGTAVTRRVVVVEERINSNNNNHNS